MKWPRRGGCARRGRMVVAVTAALLCATCESNPSVFSGPANLPNVVYIMVDDLGYGDLPAFNPDSPIDTPNLDRLATDGMTLTSFRAAAPLCSPTRAAVLTGQDPARVGIRTIVGPGSTSGLGPEHETLAEMFNGAGYQTHHVGKWHLAADPEQDPISAGFQSAIISSGFYYDYFLRMDSGPPATNGRPNQRERRVWEDHTSSNQHTTELYTDKAIELIESSVAAGAPFFLNLWYHAPHVAAGSGNLEIKWQLPTSSPLYGDSTATAADVYIELAQVVDRQVGRILAALDTEGVADETLVIFTSDNGAWEPSPNYLPWSNGGLRGRKGVHWEAGLRVPFIARWPGTVPPGTTSADFATSEDIFATIADLLGRSPPTVTEGTSLLLSLRGLPNEDANDRIIVFEGSDQAFQSDVDDVNPYDHAVIEDGRWKYISVAFRTLPELGLYDLLNDPLEEINLLNDPAQTQRVADLQAYYDGWSETMSRADLTVEGSPFNPEWSSTFDGNGWYDVDSHPTLDFGNTDFTLSLDIVADPASVVSPNGVVVADHPGAYTIVIASDGHVEVIVHNSADATVTLRSMTQIAAGTETRVSFTAKGYVSGSAAERATMGRLYIDGVREDLQPIAPAFEEVPQAGSVLRLGRGLTGNGFVGVISGVEVHNRTLTAVQLLALD